MKLKLLYGLAAVSLLAACQSNSFQINGIARAFQEGDTICLTYDDEPENVFAQTTVSDGKFEFAGETDAFRLCRAYVKRQPDCNATFFLEPGHITIEFYPRPAISRVSGTRCNNEWQHLSDSIQLLAKEIVYILRHPATDTLAQQRNVHIIDSLHRRMSDCILHTAQRNRDNPLGRYIQENYKKPEFK
mgnify:CR=1 FL=1|jgi:hypothetical protein